MGIYAELAASADKRVISRTSIINKTSKIGGFTTNAPSSVQARAVGDRFYACAVEVAKVLYKKIDARYPNRATDAAEKKLHDTHFDEARSTLNEHRNMVIKDVLPMFEVNARPKGVADTTADEHASDYIVRNAFFSMVRTLLSWIPAFVESDDIEVTTKIVSSIADLQSDKLAGELKNFAFRFRPVVAPK